MPVGHPNPIGSTAPPPKSHRLGVAALVAALSFAAASGAVEPPNLYYERPVQAKRPAAYPPPIPVFAPFADGQRTFWAPEGWAVKRLAAGAFELRGPAQAMLQVTVGPQGKAAERHLARICRRATLTNSVGALVQSYRCADGVIARRTSWSLSSEPSGVQLSVTGVMVDDDLVSRLAAVNAVSLDARPAPEPVVETTPGTISEVATPATVSLPGLGWPLALPIEESRAQDGRPSHYAVTSWTEGGGRAAVIARRMALEVSGKTEIGNARAIIAITAADTPCPASIDRSNREAWSDLDSLLSYPFAHTVSLVAPSVYAGDTLEMELCLPVAPGSVWFGVSLLINRNRPGYGVSELRTLMDGIIAASIRGAARDFLKSPAAAPGAAPDRAGRVVHFDRFNTVFASPAERARASKPTPRPAPASTCRVITQQIAAFDRPDFPHSCTGTRDEQLVFTEAWYARRAAEGWPGIYRFGAYLSRVTDRAAVAHEVGLAEALITLAQSGGVANRDAVQAYGRALQASPSPTLSAQGRAIEARNDAPSSAENPVSIEDINRSVGEYYKSLSRVGKGCTGVDACAEQARREAREALRRHER